MYNLPSQFIQFTTLLSLLTQRQIICSKNTNYLIPRSWALLDKLPVTQQLKNFPTFYGNQRLSSVLTSHQPVSILSQISSIHITQIYLTSILILSSHLRLLVISFLLTFPTKFLHVNLFFPCVLPSLPTSSSMTWLSNYTCFSKCAISLSNLWGHCRRVQKTCIKRHFAP
jgi:hypothetical protein